MPPKKKIENPPKKLSPTKSSPIKSTKTTDYSKLSVAELKELQKTRGIKDSSILKQGKTILKDDRIKALQQYDKGQSKSPVKPKSPAKKVKSPVKPKSLPKSDEDDTETMSEKEIQTLLQKQKASKKPKSPVKKRSPTKGSLKASESGEGGKTYISTEAILYGKPSKNHKMIYPKSIIKTKTHKDAVDDAIRHLFTETKKVSGEVQTELLNAAMKGLNKRGLVEFNNPDVDISAIVITRVYSNNK